MERSAEKLLKHIAQTAAAAAAVGGKQMQFATQAVAQPQQRLLGR